ncbi:plastoglobulin-1, chloroplastic [Ricinus communis]|uniref:Plastid lipid-associated protein 3, chloroplast, putative n=1 Tax=Ricinus communis TaxID=3988 RepID=B9RZ06_RICCO|nr:plastoglobulin-1, chloroplastic [Ricinus communis]EEF43508.1 Plastid lipid-associated protein 3, chloroplast precursor, putative [Ricinus communis]|eukprot:XP_002518975.1 plastoglobulin-1, chloroplastic [Ricinus communis]
MALLLSSYSNSSLFSEKLTSPPSLLPSSNIPTSVSFFFNKPSRTLLLASTNLNFQSPTFPSLIPCSSLSEPTPEPEPDPNPNPPPLTITDEWGEQVEPETQPEYPKGTDEDPPKDDDEWGAEYESGGNGSAGGLVVEKDDRIEDLKRCLVDTVYGTKFGFQASPEIRGEVLELVNQLEALNPTPAPVDSSQILDGTWILLYTAFSELLPLLAVGSVPLLKVEKISQEVDTSNLSIVNSTTLSSPFATFSFSASASFEVRSSSRIQVEFREGSLQPPEINSKIDLPVNVDVFGQNINLSPLQQSLNPLQELVANISRTISGQPPLKVPIPGDRSRSWLLITYLDEDLRISRGDGGLFVLVKEGSPLLD